MNLKIEKVSLNDDILNVLIDFSSLWEEENSCYGYRKNERDDIEGNVIYLAYDKDKIIGYSFGHKAITDKNQSIYEANEPYFELDELYVLKGYRSQGVGKRLFEFLENDLKSEVSLILLSTATKNYKAILHFYIEEMEMDFWSARLYKRLK